MEALEVRAKLDELLNEAGPVAVLEELHRSFATSGNDIFDQSGDTEAGKAFDTMAIHIRGALNIAKDNKF